MADAGTVGGVFSASFHVLCDEGAHTNLRELRMMNTLDISEIDRILARRFPSGLPSHCMPARCKSDGVGLVETRSRKTC